MAQVREMTEGKELSGSVRGTNEGFATLSITVNYLSSPVGIHMT